MRQRVVCWDKKQGSCLPHSDSCKHGDRRISFDSFLPLIFHSYSLDGDPIKRKVLLTPPGDSQLGLGPRTAPFWPAGHRNQPQHLVQLQYLNHSQHKPPISSIGFHTYHSTSKLQCDPRIPSQPTCGLCPTPK